VQLQVPTVKPKSPGVTDAKHWIGMVPFCQFT